MRMDLRLMNGCFVCFVTYCFPGDTTKPAIIFMAQTEAKLTAPPLVFLLVTWETYNQGRHHEVAMPKIGVFQQLLELADTLSLDEKETFLQVLRQRTIAQRRKQLAQDSRSARKEFRQGRAKPITAQQLMQEIKA